ANSLSYHLSLGVDQMLTRNNANNEEFAVRDINLSTGRAVELFSIFTSESIRAYWGVGNSLSSQKNGLASSLALRYRYARAMGRLDLSQYHQATYRFYEKEFAATG